MQIRTLLLVSIALRLALIGYGELQDCLLPVKYTDIDYSVFTDAARFVSQGRSPFLRSTYRYSPLLAYLLLPNVLLSRVWGKALFAGADVLAAWQIWRIGQLQQLSESRCFWSIMLWLYNPFTVTISTRGSCDSLATVMLLAVLLLLLQGRRLLPALLYGLAVHFRIYPIVYAPAIVLYLAHRQQQQQQQEQDDQQRGTSSSQQSWLQWTATWLLAVLQQGLGFGCPAAAVFLLLGVAFYNLYGQGFLHEAFLHHLVRKDPRHSFSMYYYPVYLEFMPWPGTSAAAAAAGAAAGGPAAAAGLDPAAAVTTAAEHVGDLVVGSADAVGVSSSSSAAAELVWSVLQRLLPSPAQIESLWQQLGRLLAALPAVQVGRLAIVPQAVLLLVLALALHRNQPLCWLLQTMAFVAFNKVCTAQYFVWYYSLLPVALQGMPWPLPTALQATGAVWVLAQLHWLLWGYMLEFEGAAVHLALWWAGALFLVANTACMWVLLGCTRLYGPVDGGISGAGSKTRTK